MKANRFNSEQIFDSQIKGLQNKGAPGRVWHQLNSFKDKVLSLDWEDHEFTVPFLPIIPLSLWSFDKQLNSFKLHDKENISKIHRSDRIKNLPDIPEDPYYLLGIHEGADYAKHNLNFAKDYFLMNSLLGLSLAECFSLVRYTGILAKHNIAALSSYHHHPDDIILIEIEKNQPIINFINLHKHGHNIAAPNALERLL